MRANRRALWWASIVASALAPHGCGREGAPAVESRALGGAPMSLRVAADRPELLDWPAQERSISLATTHFLFVRLQVPRELLLPVASPVAWVTLRLIAPGGAVHLERHVPFAVDPAITQTASLHGVQHPINVVRAVPSEGGYALDMPILVGGSNLQRRPLPGDWTVRATLDARPEATVQTIVPLHR